MKNNFRYVVLPEKLYLEIVFEAKKRKHKINDLIGLAWDYYVSQEDLKNTLEK